MILAHCERCRFNFEPSPPPASSPSRSQSEPSQPACPQCGHKAVPAAAARRAEPDSSTTRELEIIPPPIDD